MISKSSGKKEVNTLVLTKRDSQKRLAKTTRKSVFFLFLYSRSSIENVGFITVER